MELRRAPDHFGMHTRHFVFSQSPEWDVRTLAHYSRESTRRQVSSLHGNAIVTASHAPIKDTEEANSDENTVTSQLLPSG